ncbi:hypothetical protein [Streptomyces sp. WAC06614]|uniref:hypothetical protein n=1 Tax=Streptomyces sp. WAC06614 TaxID=2487416 RepID=UPI00163BC2E3|nr:hypothetical protein [Streptomyces sp. WAC06614]
MADHHALGWQTYGGSIFHTGDLPGTNSFMARTADGYGLAVLTNTRRKAPTDPGNVEENSLLGLGHPMWSLRDQVDAWT